MVSLLEVYALDESGGDADLRAMAQHARVEVERIARQGGFHHLRHMKEIESWFEQVAANLSGEHVLRSAMLRFRRHAPGIEHQIKALQDSTEWQYPREPGPRIHPPVPIPPQDADRIMDLFVAVQKGVERWFRANRLAPEDVPAKALPRFRDELERRLGTGGTIGRNDAIALLNKARTEVGLSSLSMGGGRGGGRDDHQTIIGMLRRAGLEPTKPGVSHGHRDQEYTFGRPARKPPSPGPVRDVTFDVADRLEREFPTSRELTRADMERIIQDIVGHEVGALSGAGNFKWNPTRVGLQRKLAPGQTYNWDPTRRRELEGVLKFLVDRSYELQDSPARKPGEMDALWREISTIINGLFGSYDNESEMARLGYDVVGRYGSRGLKLRKRSDAPPPRRGRRGTSMKETFAC